MLIPGCEKQQFRLLVMVQGGLVAQADGVRVQSGPCEGAGVAAGGAAAGYGNEAEGQEEAVAIFEL